MAQAKLDITSLTQALANELTHSPRHTLTDTEQQSIYAEQAQAYRWAFLCAGIAHPNVVKILDQLSPGAKEKAITLTKQLSH